MCNQLIADISKKYPIVPQFIKFAMIGFMNFFVDLSVLNALMIGSGRSEGLYYTAFKAMSFLVAVTFSYFFNKRWAFRDKKKTQQGRQFSQFLSVSIVGMIINVSAASILVNYIAPQISFVTLAPKLWGNLGAVAGAATGLVWNFIGYKFWVFKK